MRVVEKRESFQVVILRVIPDAPEPVELEK
jgi:hypothetical protein